MSIDIPTADDTPAVHVLPEPSMIGLPPAARTRLTAVAARAALNASPKLDPAQHLNVLDDIDRDAPPWRPDGHNLKFTKDGRGVLEYIDPDSVRDWVEAWANTLLIVCEAITRGRHDLMPLIQPDAVLYDLNIKIGTDDYQGRQKRAADTRSRYARLNATAARHDTEARRRVTAALADITRRLWPATDRPSERIATAAAIKQAEDEAAEQRRIAELERQLAEAETQSAEIDAQLNVAWAKEQARIREQRTLAQTTKASRQAQSTVGQLRTQLADATSTAQSR